LDTPSVDEALKVEFQQTSHPALSYGALDFSAAKASAQRWVWCSTVQPNKYFLEAGKWRELVKTYYQAGSMTTGYQAKFMLPGLSLAWFGVFLCLSSDMINAGETGAPLTATALNAPDYAAQERAAELSESAHHQPGEVEAASQKGKETLQRTPNAITVLDGQRIIDQGIGRSAGEILNYVPNASAATQFHGQPQWRIRGQ